MKPDTINALWLAMGKPKISPTEYEVLKMSEEDIKKEYELIRQNQSGLSASKREGVIAIFEFLKYFKEVK